MPREHASAPREHCSTPREHGSMPREHCSTPRVHVLDAARARPAPRVHVYRGRTSMAPRSASMVPRRASSAPYRPPIILANFAGSLSGSGFGAQKYVPSLSSTNVRPPTS